MPYFSQTNENCHAFLCQSPLVVNAFENLRSSSCQGYEFTLKNGYSVKLRLDDSVHFAILELFPGIHVQSPFQGMVAEYCLWALPFPSPTCFVFSPEQGDIYHHSEQSFRDQAISPGMFSRMLARAIKETEAHFFAFQSLAYGRLPDLKQLARQEEEKANVADTPSDKELQLREDAGLVIYDYLEHCGHNVMGVSLKGEGTAAFFSESLTHTCRHRSYFHFRGEHLILAARTDIRPDAALRSRVAACLNEATSTKKVSHLTLDNDGYLCAVISHSLFHSAETLSHHTLKQLDYIVLTSVDYAAKSLQKILCGNTAAEEQLRKELDIYHDSYASDLEDLDWDPILPTGGQGSRLPGIAPDELLMHIRAMDEEDDLSLDEEDDSWVIPDPTGIEETPEA